MRLPDDVLVPKLGEEDRDPISENVAAAMGRPIYVLPKQEHVNHLKVHMSFLQSPVFGQNPAIVKTYLWPMAQHLRDHLLNYYLVEAHHGVQIASKNGTIVDEDGEKQAQVVATVQRQIEQELQGFAQMLAQIDQMAQQFAPRPQLPPDSSLQIAQMNNQLNQQALQQKVQADAQRLQLEQAKLQTQAQRDAQRLQLEAQQKESQARADMLKEQLRQQMENDRTRYEMGIRQDMNTADNETAMRLAALEISSGEHFSVSTGTGINPG
jgi:hypothetical protein